MRQKSNTSETPSERLVRDIRRATRKQYSAEEKIRIVLDGLRGEVTIAELCRREGIAESLYYSWSKEFLEAGKRRLTKDRLASFEKWDDMIRQCVLWLAQKGVAELGDPTVCIDTAKEQEPDRQKLAAFLDAAASTMGDADWRVADLVRHASLPDDGGNWKAALQDALEEIAGERGAINPRILGRWIERYDRTRCAGFYLERRGRRQRAILWRIRRYGEPLSAENNSQNSRNSQRGLSLAFRSAGAESSEIAIPTGLTAANDHLEIAFGSPSLTAANRCG
jgi:transposase